MIRPVLSLERLIFPEGEGQVGYRHNFSMTPKGKYWVTLDTH